MPLEDQTRLLKLGVTAGPDLRYRAYFVAPAMLTVGRSTDAVLTLDHPDVPELFELVSINDSSCLLQFTREMDLNFLHDGLYRRPNYLIDEGLAFRRGRNYVLNLETSARGTLNLGPFRLLFKLEVVSRPSFRMIPLPQNQESPVHCAACRQSLETVLPSAGVVTRCSFCKSLNRFEGVTGETMTIRPPQQISEDITAETPEPVLLQEPSFSPAAPEPQAQDSNSTVLDVGVLPTDSGSAARPQLVPGDTTPPGGIDLSDPSEKATVAFENQKTGMYANEMVEEPERQLLQRAVSGDGFSSIVEEDNPVNSTAGAHWSSPSLANVKPDALRETTGNVVPLRISRSVERPPPEMSSAPVQAVPEPPRPASSTDSVAAAKLADRLTMLIFTLVVIALPLAMILGVLLMQGVMRRFSVPTAADVTSALVEPVSDGADD